MTIKPEVLEPQLVHNFQGLGHVLTRGHFFVILL